jgi:hypothetical protein
VEYFDISPSVARRKLHRPPNHPKTTKVISQGIQILRQILTRPLSRDHHQLDMKARDKLIEQHEKRRLAGYNNSIAHIHSNKPRYASAATQTELDDPHHETSEPIPSSDELIRSKDSSSRQELIDPLVKELPQKSTSVTLGFKSRPELARHPCEID